jgi:predicted RNA-binding protein Jag
MQETVHEIALKFFTLMGVEVEAVVVEAEEEKRRIFRVTVKTPDSKLLIGVHGQTLETMRHLLTRLVERTVGKSFLIHLEVNDYLQSKDQRLFRQIEDRIAVIMRTGGDVALFELSNYERKKVHAYVAEKKVEGLSTRSVGEGAERVLHLMFSGTPTNAPARSAEISEHSNATPRRPETPHAAVPRPEAPSRPVRSALDELSEDGVGI